MPRRLCAVHLRREADPPGAAREEAERGVRPAAHPPAPQPLQVQAQDEGVRRSSQPCIRRHQGIKITITFILKYHIVFNFLTFCITFFKSSINCGIKHPKKISNGN